MTNLFKVEKQKTQIRVCKSCPDKRIRKRRKLKSTALTVFKCTKKFFENPVKYEYS